MEPAQHSAEPIDNDHAAAKFRPLPFNEKSIFREGGRRAVRVCASFPPVTGGPNPRTTAKEGLTTPPQSCSDNEPIQNPETNLFVDGGAVWTRRHNSIATEGAGSSQLHYPTRCEHNVSQRHRNDGKQAGSPVEPSQYITATVDNDQAATKGIPSPLNEKSILRERGRRAVRICACLTPGTGGAYPETTATSGFRTPPESCSG